MSRRSFDSLVAEFNTALSTVVPGEPASIYDPLRYLFSAGGKRLRPILSALCARISGANGNEWLPVALASELLHAFTLVHDDIMDNAESRRGKPTLHVKYGSNAAILSGDVLIALAIEQLGKSSSTNSLALVKEFGYGFRAVCEGQALDKDYETRVSVTRAEYLHMIDLKTAKVFEMSAVLGALVGDNPNAVEPLRNFAHYVGLAFQVNDDLLDLTADFTNFGKTIGGDIIEGKRTILLTSVLERMNDLPGRDKDLVMKITDRQATVADVPATRELFDRIGVIAETEKLVADLTNNANHALDELPESEQKQNLIAYSDMLLSRNS